VIYLRELIPRKPSKLIARTGEPKLPVGSVADRKEI